MGFRSKRNANKSHFQKLGEGGVDFLNAQRASNDGQEFSFNLEGYKNAFHLRKATSDVTTFYQCIFHAEYDIELPLDPKVIVDLGANIGLTSAFFKSQYPEAMIVAVEPEQSNFELLEKNLSGLSNVNTVKAGVWKRDAHLRIVDNNQGHYGFTVEEVANESEDSIEAISIESIMTKYKIDFIDVLKVDIEGSEKEVFEQNTKSWLSKVGVLIVETHDRMKPGTAKSVFTAVNEFSYSFSIKGENLVFILDHDKK